MFSNIVRTVATLLPAVLVACAPVASTVNVSASASPSPDAGVVLPGDGAFPTPPPAAKGPVAVTAVVDGDTIKVDDAGTIVTIRLIGIDTPETVHPTKPVQCYGPESTTFLKGLLAGKTVKFALDPSQDEKDRYGRILAFVWTDDGVLVNEGVVVAGAGREYTYKKPYAYQARFKSAQDVARSVNRGLWGACPDAATWATGAADDDVAVPSSSQATSTPANPVDVASAVAETPTPLPSPLTSVTPAVTPVPTAQTAVTPSPAPTATTTPPSGGASEVIDEAKPEDCGPGYTFVHGYFRKDGAYVRAHCRKKPSS